MNRYCLLIFALVLAAPIVRAAPPRHERIDALIDAKTGGTVAPAASDAEFLRRVYLDVIGDIPAASEVRAFLADTSTDKRTKVIDRLLADPRYARRMQDVVNVMLMERRETKNKSAGEWMKFLRDSFAQNKPWDELVREILAPDGADANTRAAALFYTQRLDKVGEQP